MEKNSALIGDLDQRAEYTLKESDSCKKTYKDFGQGTI